MVPTEWSGGPAGPHGSPSPPPGPADAPPPPAPRPARAVAARLMLHLLFLLVAVAALGAYEHFKLHGQSAPSLASLLAAAGFGFAPVRALARELLAIEGRLLHLLHGVGGLALVGLAAGGFVSGGPVLTRAALAPFAIMGAAQAMMHPNHPRSPEQAAALRRFVASLPEVERFARSGDLDSPAKVRGAIAVMADLVSKAQLLGETELRGDPGFQAALRRVGARFGLSLGLDVVDQAVARLSASPSAARALPDLRRRLGAARAAIER
jgi:hypothetical protein